VFGQSERRDIPGAVVRFFDTVHFALETHAAEISAAISGFLIPWRAARRQHQKQSNQTLGE
jgi:hypothetical protein